MKKTWVIGMLLLALTVPLWATASVETAVGSMQVGGKMKVVYDYVAESRSTGVAEYSSI